MEQQLNLASEKVRTAEAASAETALRFKGELARLRKECDFSWQRPATAECAETFVYKELEMVTAKISKLELEIAKL